MSDDRWYPYFTIHGDPFVVTDLDRPHITRVATVSTSPADYGRENALLLASAPDLAAEVTRLRDALSTILTSDGTLLVVKGIAQQALEDTPIGGQAGQASQEVVNVAPVIGCGCSCHRLPGVSHVVACCDTPPHEATAFGTPSEVEVHESTH